ncbi:hypothetical protein GCM10009733_020850 [Nonomuraea maheshkhaliensis]|uniref:Uncharacterized protein n=2 Tax=Nonomuraea maheshkhaliensis TaxID=419590 RepID=A0ABN2EZM3_9ACTN
MQGGLVVPAVVARHRSGRALFGINHPNRANDCLLGKLCGTCGQPLSARPGGRYALLLRLADIIRGYSSEPALHASDCARYAIAACPAMNGQMAHYRAAPRDLEADRCGDPKCDCHRWTNSDDHRRRAGAPIPPFYLATYRQEQYRPHWGSRSGHEDVLLGVALAGVEPMSVRLVTPRELSILDLAGAL